MPNEFIVKNGLISQGNITISGSITATGGVTVSGSIASASYASNAELLDGLDSTVFTLTSSFNAQTASFTAFTSSMNSFSASILTNVTALNAKTASFATTGSNTFVGAEVISGSLAISGSGTPFTLNTDTLEITGSLIVTGSTTLTGSLLQLGNFTTTGTIIAQTINVQTVTSSIVYSSGSNVFGNSLGNSQTFTGSVLITGSLTIAGASSATSYSGTTIYGSTVACSPIGCFATSCATSFIGGTMSGTTIYGSTAVCSPVGKFTSCIDAGSGTFSDNILISKANLLSSLTIKSSCSTTGLQLYLYGLNATLSNQDNGSLVFQTNGTDRLTIASTGAATFACSVTAGGTITLNVAAANYATLNLNGAAGYGAELKFGEVTGGYLAAIRHNYNVGTGLEFYTGGLGAGNLRLYITPTGNVGIGTTSPDRKLDIASANASDTKLVIRTACGFAGSYSPSLDFHVGGYESTCTTGQIKMCGTNNYSGDMIFSTQLSGTINPLVERMRITSGGNVGIGTTGPQARLQVSCTANFGAILKISDTTTESTGIIALGDGNTSVVNVGIWRAAANCMSSYGNWLNLGGYDGILFATCAAGIGSQAERMRITSGGSVSIGSASAAYNFNVYGASGADGWGAFFGGGGATKGGIYIGNAGNQYGTLYFDNGNNNVYLKQSYVTGCVIVIANTGGVYLANGGTSWAAISSDIRKKKNFETTQGLAEVLQIEPIKYHFNEDDNNSTKRLGFKAQNIKPLIPEMVLETGEFAEDGSPYLTITSDYILPVLVKAIQEQQCTICSQASMINTLKTCLGII